MTVRTWLVVLALLLGGCDRPCQRMCKNGFGKQLDRNFAPHDPVDCDAEVWLIPESCAECDAMLERELGVLAKKCSAYQ